MPGLEHARRRFEGVERRGVAVDLPALHVGGGRRFLGGHVEGITPHVPHVTEHALTDGDGDAAAGVVHDRAAGETVGRLHADGADATLAQLLGDLGEHRDGLAVDDDVELQCRVQRRQRAPRELDVDDGAGDADHPAVGTGRGGAGRGFGDSHASSFLL